MSSVLVLPIVLNASLAQGNSKLTSRSTYLVGRSGDACQPEPYYMQPLYLIQE